MRAIKINKIPLKGKIGKGGKSRASRFVLMIGDEGGILVYMRGNAVIRRLFAASPDASNTRAMNELLNQDIKAPVFLLSDMMDQNYVRQTLPPVARLSVNKLIARRMSKDLAADDIKGSILLGREKQGRKDWNYLLVSMPFSSSVKQWLDFAVERRNPFQGIYLLPMELEAFIQELATETHTAEGAQWQLLVSHNKIGGFRQVILHQGKMVFTRMALPIGESVPDVIAGNIEQEILNTMEYLKRMGFQENAVLDVHIIVSQDIKEAIDAGKIKARNVMLYTPFEASEKLKLVQAAQLEDHFGDVVAAAFFGSRKKHALQLQTPYTKRLKIMQDGILATKSVAAIASVLLLGLTLKTAVSIIQLYDEAESWDRRRRSAEADLADTQKKADQLPGNIEKISDIVSLYKTFDINSYRPLSFVKRLADTLPESARINTLSWQVENAMGVTSSVDNRKIRVEFQLRLTQLSSEREERKNQWDATITMLQKTFDDFEFQHSGIPGEIGENEVFQTNFTQNNTASQNTEEFITITLNGPKAKPPQPVP